MQCDSCKKKGATVHLTQILEGKLQKVDLCDDCARDKGVQDPGGFSLASLLVSLGTSDEGKGELPDAKCAVCGFTQADFKKTGRLGCSACWDTFGSGLISLLTAMHKVARHVGKVPGRAMNTMVITEKIKELTAELEKAIQAEKYEDAALFRDQIRDLESKLKASASVAL